MGAEDFSFFLNAIPGCFFFVGSAPNESTVGVLEPTCPSDHEHSAEEILDRPHHRSDFDIHEDSLLVGASIWVQLVEDILGKKNFVTESSLSKKRKVDS